MFAEKPDILSKQQRRRLTRRSNTKGLIRLSSHLALIVATGLLVWRFWESSFLFPAMWVHGVALVFLFAPLHETIHRTAFKSGRLNSVVAWAAGLVLILPPRFFRAFHLAHHRHTQDLERDPELISRKPDTLVAYLRHVSGLPYWWDRVTTLSGHARGRLTESYIEYSMRNKIVLEARVFLTVYALLVAGSLLAGSDFIVWYWLVPVLIGQPVLRLFLLAEHTGCPYVPDMLRNSRTTYSNRLMRFLTWNMPYHSAHHYIASVPFHALPSLHAHLRDHIECQATGYWHVHKGLVANLR